MIIPLEGLARQEEVVARRKCGWRKKAALKCDSERDDGMKLLA